MLNNRILAVIKRELREKLASKAFIIMTLLMPILMLGLGGLSSLFVQMGSTTYLTVVTENKNLTDNFKSVMDKYDFVKDGTYKIDYETMPKEQFKDYLASIKKKILDEKISAVLYVPETAFKDKKIEYYAKTPNLSISEKLNQPINKILVNSYFQGKLTPEELNFASGGVDFKGYTVTEKAEVKDQSYGNLILAYVFMFLLFLGMIQMGAFTMQSVIEEKNNRIVEILLSSLSPTELLTGKIIGSSITGLIQMAIWLTPVVLISSGTLFMLPAQFTISITTLQLVYLLITFLFGLLIFTGLYAVLGSIFDNPQDAQQGQFPVMMLIMIPYFLAINLLQNPTSQFAVIASFFPFANIILMPVRFAIVEIPMWHLLVSVIVNILTLYFVAWFAGKIYRIGILRTGTKPKWSEVIKWIKYKY